MRIDSNVVASVMSAVKPSSGNQGLGQLIDLAIQKQGIRGDASIPEEMKAAMVAKLDKRSAPIQQGMETDQTRLTTQQLIEEAEKAAEEARKAGENGQDQTVDGVSDPSAVNASAASTSTSPAEAAPVADAEINPVGQNIDDYA